MYVLIIFQQSQFIGFVGLIIGGGHVIPIGAQGWFHPYCWPGYLIPLCITESKNMTQLLFFLFFTKTVFAQVSTDRIL